MIYTSRPYLYYADVVLQFMGNLSTRIKEIYSRLFDPRQCNHDSRIVN